MKYIFIVLFSLMLCACQHGAGDPGSVSMAKNFIPLKTLMNRKLYITFADSKGLFSKRQLEDYYYQFSDNASFKFYQTAENKLISSGNYKYATNLKKPRVATLVIKNKTGVFANKTFLMRLSYYNRFMGTFKVWLSRQSKTNYATGIFKIE